MNDELKPAGRSPAQQAWQWLRKHAWVLLAVGALVTVALLTWRRHHAAQHQLSEAQVSSTLPARMLHETASVSEQQQLGRSPDFVEVGEEKVRKFAPIFTCSHASLPQHHGLVPNLVMHTLFPMCQQAWGRRRRLPKLGGQSKNWKYNHAPPPPHTHTYTQGFKIVEHVGAGSPLGRAGGTGLKPPKSFWLREDLWVGGQGKSSVLGVHIPGRKGRGKGAGAHEGAHGGHTSEAAQQAEVGVGVEEGLGGHALRGGEPGRGAPHTTHSSTSGDGGPVTERGGSGAASHAESHSSGGSSSSSSGGGGQLLADHKVSEQEEERRVQEMTERGSECFDFDYYARVS